MYQSVAKQSLSEAVFLQLQDRIISQRLPAGEELPSERKLAELLGVNRGAVREAIKRLQQAGLIEVRHGGNSTVMNYLETSGMELLPTLLVDANGHINAAVARIPMMLRARPNRRWRHRYGRCSARCSRPRPGTPPRCRNWRWISGRCW